MTSGLASLPGPTLPSHAETTALRAGDSVNPKLAAELRRRAVLNGCKWDPQVGDVATLAPFPLIIKRTVWDQLSLWAERLALEAEAAEWEICRRADLLRALGLPRHLQSVLAAPATMTPSAGRVVRFDFHFTTEGWRVSEANSDVPGGFSEGSYFTALMAQQFPGLRTAGDPGGQWCNALCKTVGNAGVVALLSAPGYMEDQQVVSFLASKLRELGRVALLAKPEQIRWQQGYAHLNTRWHQGPVDAIVRFYQAEWIAALPESVGWKQLFRAGKTPVANPALAAITESKRFPLVWDNLSTLLPTWRALLPETRAPQDASWFDDDGWIVKTAMCNTGDTVCIRELMSWNRWLQTRFSVFIAPERWVAQRRFESVPIPTPSGPRHVCVGVYTVNGRTAGAYARLAEKPLIDFQSVDVALLIENDD